MCSHTLLKLLSISRLENLRTFRFNFSKSSVLILSFFPVHLYNVRCRRAQLQAVLLHSRNLQCNFRLLSAFENGRDMNEENHTTVFAPAVSCFCEVLLQEVCLLCCKLSIKLTSIVIYFSPSVKTYGFATSLVRGRQGVGCFVATSHQRGPPFGSL